ncbi:MAG: DNA ligase D [Gemmatimonadetes bacterium]|nr:DNA ligase D [Gemmatimonadota bacterium]
MAATDKPTSDQLRAYREKRSPEATPEPFGPGRVAGGRQFVVQKHFATRLHYDFRLEHDGVLKSWAVPKGPSFDQQEKRLAVETEDHPIEYADFEGIIPAGNYGAGAVIVWDRGVWIPREDFAEGMEKGKLLFELRGFKLHGSWTLVRLKKGSGKEWLMIKERDAWMSPDGDESVSERSVFSGLTVEELKAGRDLAREARDRLAELGAKQRSLRVRDVGLMLAQTRDDAFTDAGWVFELKYDGYRLLASREGGTSRPVLMSRNGHDLTAVFPEVAHAVETLPYSDFVLDGEVVVHDDSGRPSFQRLQKRGRLTQRYDIQRATLELPAVFYAFDLLALEGFDLRQLPLVQRKAVLQEALPPVGLMKYAEHIAERGEDFYEQVQAMELEGIMAKKADSRYRAGRSASWFKIRSDRTDDFVIVGYSDPKGSGNGFGALHLASYHGGQLTYAGRVGTGFSAQQRDDIVAELQTIARPDPPCTGATPKGDEHHWVEPELVVEVRYKEWTEEAFLRHPVFLRFRDDKDPHDCVRQETELDLRPPEAPEESTVQRVVPFSNQDKIFWPQEGYTKGNLIEYYRDVSEWLLPYVRDRPVIMTRYPDGIDGKSFFQKDAPEWVPEWVRTEKVWSQDSGKETNYFIGDDVETILYIANMGSIPLHVWSSRLTSLERPDWSILDLDPKDAPFADVVRVANSIHALCDEIELPCFVKTSGSSGLHVLVPLGRQCTYEQSKGLAELLARVTASELPEIATTARALSARQGRVYIDFGQNGHGKLLVSPLCVRPLPGAPVSMPLRWNEVNRKLDIRKYTIKNAVSRLRRMKEDPLAGVLTEKPDLAAVLGRLAERMGENQI